MAARKRKGVGVQYSVSSPGAKQARANNRYGIGRRRPTSRPAAPKPKTGMDYFNDIIMKKNP